MWFIDQVRLTTRVPVSGKPFGLGSFDPIPSGFGLSGPPAQTAPKPSILCQMTFSRVIQYSPELL